MKGKVIFFFGTMAEHDDASQPDDPGREYDGIEEQEDQEEDRVVNINIDPAPRDPDVPHVEWVGLLSRMDRHVGRVREVVELENNQQIRKLEYFTVSKHSFPKTSLRLYM